MSSRLPRAVAERQPFGVRPDHPLARTTEAVRCTSRIVAQVADELRELGAVLRAGGVSARGVASLERLVSHATSPLYGRDVAALRDELRRAQELLKEHDK